MSWPVVDLTNVCRPKQWPTISKSDLLASGFPVYGANGRIGFYSEYNHEEPTILITCRGATCGTINVCDSQSYVTGNAMALDDLDRNRVDLRFMVYALRDADFSSVITGVAQPQITRETLSRLQVPLPALAEQKRIAGILDAADALRAKRREALAQLDSLLQATFLDLFGDPVTNPKGWEVVPLEMLCERIVDCPHSTPEYSERQTGLFCVRSADIQNGRIDLSDARHVEQPIYGDRVRRHVPRTGEVIYTREGGRLGLAAQVPPRRNICLGQRMMLFDANRKRASNAFIWGLLNSASIYKLVNAMSGGGAAPRVNIKQLRKIEAICPPVSVQHSFDKVVASVGGMAALGHTHLAELDTLFASLQSRAFRGEL